MINIKDVFRSCNIELNDYQVQQFIDYYHLLIDYNKVMNLTSITEYDEVVIKHFLDSVIPYIYIEKDSRVIDVGTGAGFPSIPLKIVRPDLNMVLVDSLNKRINFLNVVIEKLKLKKILTIHSRSEDLAKDEKFREEFDYCVSRAVAKLNTLSELCVPFVKVNGNFIAYKGSNYLEEINSSKNALSLLSCKIENIKNYELPEDMGIRSVIIIKKLKKTAKIYPRKNNLPKNKPL
ncbi:MAG: 16S rRNA (guanine(527)-N(7))-methyltransferase RsmG [Christensenellales bacterium]